MTLESSAVERHVQARVVDQIERAYEEILHIEAHISAVMAVTYEIQEATYEKAFRGQLAITEADVGMKETAASRIQRASAA